MKKNILLITISLLLIFSNFSIAEEKTTSYVEENSKQTTLVKQICSKNSLEKDINKWVNENPDYQMKDITHFIYDYKNCVLIIYEMDE